MAHTNSTSNYGLPQWIGTDKPTFLGDFNTAFYDIDAQMKTNADAAAAATTTANTAASAASTASTNATTALNTANSAANEAASATSAAASATSTANNAATDASAALRASAANTIENLAPAYDPTLTYSVGDLVTYIDDQNSGKLYKCIVAVTSPEAFNINKWDDVTTSDIYSAKPKVVASYTVQENDTFDAVYSALAAAVGTFNTNKRYILKIIENGLVSNVPVYDVASTLARFSRTVVTSYSVSIEGGTLSSDAARSHLWVLNTSSTTYTNKTSDRCSYESVALIEY